jgi:hypothetical protein
MAFSLLAFFLEKRPESRALDAMDLFPQVQPSQKGPIPIGRRSSKIVQKLTPLVHHDHQAPAGTKVLAVLLKVGRQLVDSMRKDGYLNVCRARIPFVNLETADDLHFVSALHALRWRISFFAKIPLEASEARGFDLLGFPEPCRGSWRREPDGIKGKV